MAENKGRDIVVSVSSDDTSYSTIAELNSAEMNLQGNTLDVTKFGDDTIRRILGLKDCSWSFDGFYDPTDTDGQAAVTGSLLNDTPLYVKIIFVPGASAGSQGFKQQCVVSKVDVKGGVADVVAASFSCDGSGTITAV